MGSKKVCLSCRFSLSREITLDSKRVFLCPQCRKPMKLLPHRFRPPRKTDLKAWELVGFLIQNGFPYQHIYQIGSTELVKSKYNNYTPYPKNLRDAKEFIEQNKMYSKKKSKA